MYDTDRHHIFWPRRNYTTPLEKAFRNLPCNVIRLPVGEHRLIHATQSAPAKPSHHEIASLVNLHRDGNCLFCLFRDAGGDDGTPG